MEPLALTAAGIAAAARGRVVQGEAGRVIGRVSIDTRTLQPGDFYVALRGERFDGHRFVADALQRGAIGALIDDPRAADAAAGARDGVVVQVEDTTRALQEVARDIRRRAGARVVAITGSAGKTTTKEIAADFLSTRFQVFRNKGNLNNHIGLPLSLLELRSRPEIAVVELGMNHPGEIRALVAIAEPDLRVWTNVGDAHLGFFRDADAIADAKAEILEMARPGDVVVVNANDARVMARAQRFAGRVITFGIEIAADLEATDVRHRGLDGTSALLRTAAGEIRIDTPLLGLGNLANILAAAAVAVHLGIPVSEIASRAAALRPAHHRGELLRLPGGVTLIDDSYNSSPSALKRALETVGVATGSARKIAILGEMLELGDHATDLHTECGRAAAAAGLHCLVTVGGAPVQALGTAAVAAGMPSACVRHVGSKEEATDLAVKKVRPGDLVLVKGSRGIGTDHVVERLKVEFA